MLKLNKATTESVKSLDLKELFPDISNEMKIKIDESIALKKDIIDYVNKDKAGIQFNACRKCNIPKDPKPLEEEVNNLEFEFENMEPDDDRYKLTKKRLFLKKKELEKLKKPYKYFDDICECYLICPLYNSGNAPIGEVCYFEYQKVSQSTEGYFNEFSIDVITKNIAKEQIAQIVLCDLLIYRASKALAVTNLTTITEKIGELGIEYSRQRNHLIGIINDQSKMRIKLLETMLGTPEIKRKYKLEQTKNIKQAEAEKETAEFIQKKESVKTNKMPTLIKINQEELEKIDDAEVL